MSELSVLGEVGHESFDVVVIGSGPAGVAVAERLHAICSTATIAIIERGPLVLRRHFYDSGGSILERNSFWARHRECPWVGDLSPGGALLPGLGGRGIVGGSQLHRFYERDLTLWPQGMWPMGAEDLDPYFLEAEEHLLGAARSVGPAQDLACLALAHLDARHPPHALAYNATLGADTGFPHQSSVQRVLALLEKDQMETPRRLAVLTETRAVRLVTRKSQPEQVSHVRCVRPGPSPISVDIATKVVVLAASPVESARLVLVSGLEGSRSNSSAVGRYLAEHIYARGSLDISRTSELTNGPINVFIPPPANGLNDRFQIELRSMPRSEDSPALVRVTGSAAMDPNRDNRVTLSTAGVDDLGVPLAHTVLTPSHQDERRTAFMLEALNQVASRLGGRWAAPPTLLPRGASYHEAGTLRIAAPGQESAADAHGLLLGTKNVFVGDGAAFASVGVANPILTITAMGYRLADRLCRVLGSTWK